MASCVVMTNRSSTTRVLPRQESALPPLLLTADWCKWRKWARPSGNQTRAPSAHGPFRKDPHPTSRNIYALLVQLAHHVGSTICVSRRGPPKESQQSRRFAEFEVSAQRIAGDATDPTAAVDAEHRSNGNDHKEGYAGA